MGKTFDKIGLAFLTALLSFWLFFRLTDSIALGALCALLFVATLALFLRLLHPRTPKNLLSKRNFIRYVLLNGNATLKRTVEASFGKEFHCEDAEGHTILIDEQRRLIYYTYKFGSLSEEDVAKSYRLAEKYRCEAIYALTNHLDRKAIAVAEYIPQRFTVIGASALYKYLLKKKLLPPKEAMERKKGKRFTLLKTALNARNAKYFVWAGLSTSLLALFTPITTYYIVFSFINLLVAIACVLFSEKSEGRNELFKG